jgi:hypothetical protein
MFAVEAGTSYETMKINFKYTGKVKIKEVER